MTRRTVALLLAGVLAGEAVEARAEDARVTIALRDGSRLVGRIVSEDEGTLEVVTEGGARVTVPRGSVASIVSDGEGAGAAGADPNYSRLMFAPTGRPLAKGDGYFSDYELVFPGVAFGLTDNVSVAGGVSAIPGLGLGEQLFYISPKIGWNLGENASVAVGGLFAGAGDDGDRESLGIGFAVGTFGGRDRSLTLGFGASRVSDDSATTPILMIGGTATLSRHVALVTESWLFLDGDFELDQQPFGVGVRFFGDTLSADVGVILVGELLDEGFPLPWVSITYHFGNGRSRPRP